MQLTDLQWSQDRTYFITASKDKTAKLVSAADLEVLKSYPTDTSLNSACITPRKDFVILGGGQAAMDVTTTAARQGKFEARFYHKIFEDEIGRVRGHFGPLVSPGRPRRRAFRRGHHTNRRRRTPLPPTPPAKATPAAGKTATCGCTSLTRATSTSCTRWSGSGIGR